MKICGFLVSVMFAFFSTNLHAQTWGCAGGYPDANALNSFDTSNSSGYSNNYVSDMKAHYESINPAEIDPTCKEELDQAFSCCMNPDSCGSYQGSFLTNTGETSDVALRAQTVNAALESLNAGAAGTMLCQLKRESCSNTCAQGTGIGDTKGRSICDGLIISEHQANKVSQGRLMSACTSLNGLNNAADSSGNYNVVCSGSPTPCQLVGN